MQNSWMSRTLQGKRWLMEKRLEAVEQNDVDQLLELLSYQSQPSPKELTSALETAILKKSDDYAKCIEILLAKGANPSGTNGSGSPFVLLAADAGCEAVVHLLLESGCDLNQTRDDGATALHRAAWNNHATCLQMLLEGGADANVRDLQGRTALMLAAQANNMDVIVRMLNGDFKCDLNICDNMGRSLIYWAMLHIDEDNLEMLSLLAQAGCNVNVQDIEGCTPLMLACSLGDFPSVEFLLTNGADVNLCDYDGDTALLLAAEGPHISCVHALLARGADVNAKNQALATALLYLIDYPSIVSQLLSAGASVNLITKHGVSPLWIATYNDSAESVRLLLKANSDPTKKAGFEEEKLPLQIALYDGSLAVVQLLFMATLAWGGDIKWLDQYLKEPTFLVNCRRYPRARRCKEWIEAELQYCDGGETLMNRCRRKVRQCLGHGSLGDKIQALPLPAPIKGYMDLKELEAVQCQADDE